MKESLPYLTFGFIVFLEVVVFIVYTIRNEGKIKALVVGVIDLKVIQKEVDAKIDTSCREVESKINEFRKENLATAKRVHGEIDKRVIKTDCMKEMDDGQAHNLKVCKMIEKLDVRLGNMELSLNTLATQYKSDKEKK